MASPTAPLAHRTRWDLLPLWEWQYDRAVHHAVRSPAQSQDRRYYEARARLYLQLVRLLAPSATFWRTVRRLPGAPRPGGRSQPFSRAALRQWVADQRTAVARGQQQQIYGPPLALEHAAALDATEAVLAEARADAHACATYEEAQRSD